MYAHAISDQPTEEAYHNPAAVWWGACAASVVIRDQRSPSSRGPGPPGSYCRDRQRFAPLDDFSGKRNVRRTPSPACLPEHCPPEV